ncbi:MAG: glycoside hydrolase family 15 protein, partial [Myxococcales bacterium]
LERRWHEPDHGIWEVRRPARHFTHSKIMAWVAFDRAIKSVDQFGLEGPVDHWRLIRDRIHAEVCDRGYDDDRETFTQSYDDPALDASLLLTSLVGFLPVDDPRIIGTIRAIERDLLHEGLVLRYLAELGDAADGLPPGEGVFVPCSFWLADVYVQMDRRDAALRLFERLLTLRNDLGLLSEEYDPRTGRLLGNFPQAFSHLSLVNTAYNLTLLSTGPAHSRHRADGEGDRIRSR